MAMVDSTAEAKAAQTAGDVQSRPPKVAPDTKRVSPRQMIMNRPTRSAMWPPSTFQSAVVERPRPGTQK